MLVDETEKMDFDHYNILLASSSEMFKQVLVVMMSAILNSGKPCHFYIMQSDWNPDLKSQCASFVSMHPDNEVYFLEVDDSKLNFLKPFKGKYGTYYKLFAHEYLPAHVKRILYLDVDVIIRKDISDFYFDDFEDLYFIAINSLMEMNPKFKNKDFNPKQNELCLRKSTNSNPGVLLINIDKLRRENFNMEYYKDIISQISGDYWYEEGILNHLFTYKRKYVPAYKWQTMIGFIDRYKQVFSLDKKTREEEYNEFYSEDFDEKNELAIVHFVLPKCKTKPWDINYDYENHKVYDAMGNNLSPIEEQLYLEWWAIAKELPEKNFYQLLLGASEFNYKKKADELNNANVRILYSNNVMKFLSEFIQDTYEIRKFERYIKNLSGKNIAILKQQDAAASVLKKVVEYYNVNITCLSNQPSLNQLTSEEFAECKKADVIITCCVHGTQTHEFNGVKCIDIWDILHDDSLTADLPALPETGCVEMESELKRLSDELVEQSKSLSMMYAACKDSANVVSNLTAKTEALNEKVDELNDTNSRLAIENIHAMQMYDDEKKANLAAAQKIDKLTSEKNSMSKRISELEMTLKAEQGESALKGDRITALSERISEMENSRSWRWTRIFRKKKDE